MALVTFVDDNAPYLNAQNLNNNFNECYERAAIMVYLNANTTLATTSWVQVTIPFNAVKYNYGNKFTLNTSTGVVSYSGDRQLKATVHITRDASSSGSLYPTCSLISGVEEITNDDRAYAQFIGFGSASTITGKISTGTTGNQVLTGNASNMYTYMIIEEM